MANGDRRKVIRKLESAAAAQETCVKHLSDAVVILKDHDPNAETEMKALIGMSDKLMEFIMETRKHY